MEIELRYNNWTTAIITEEKLEVYHPITSKQSI
jgi:hypothetical protein